MTTLLDPTLEAELATDNPLLFFAVALTIQSESPETVLRLIDGSIADIVIDGNTYKRSHDTYGTMSVTDPIVDGLGDESPHINITYYPPSNVAAADLAAAAQQGAPVELWFGAIDRVTGQPKGTPELLFAGEVDQPVLHVGENSRSVDIDVASVFERLFESDESITLTTASHQVYYPGELGFEMVVDIDRQLPWGTDAPRPGVVTSVNAYGSPYYSGSAYQI